MREPWLVLVPTWARADGLCGTPDMSPALNYKALLYATPTHLPSICPFTRPHVIISALSMHLPPVLWAWIRAPATHFLGARILTTLPLSIPPAAFSALPQHLPSPFSVIILSSQYLFQRGPIWVTAAGSKALCQGDDTVFRLDCYTTSISAPTRLVTLHVFEVSFYFMARFQNYTRYEASVHYSPFSYL